MNPASTLEVPRSRSRRKSSFLENRAQAMTIASVGRMPSEITEECSIEENVVADNFDEEKFSMATYALLWMQNIAYRIFIFGEKILSTMAAKNRNDVLQENRFGRRSLFEFDEMDPHSSLSTLRKGLNVGQSRELHIRNVTVIRYLNKAMPSLNEYFLGEGYRDNDGKTDEDDDFSKRRWSNLSVLLRQKVRKASFPEVVTKTIKENRKKKFSQRTSVKHLPSMDADENWHEKYRNIRRRHCAKPDCNSSSSSENDFKNSDSESRNAETPNLQTIARENPSTRFGLIFNDQSNTADFILKSTIQRNTSEFSHLKKRKNSFIIPPSIFTSTSHKAKDVYRSTTINFIENIINTAIKEGISTFLRNNN